MDLKANLYLELDIDLEAAEGGPFSGGEFSIRELVAVGDRGFLELNYFRMDGRKQDLEGFYLYELENFNPASYKGVTLTSKRTAIFHEESLKPLKLDGLDESRVVKLDDVTFYQKVAQEVGQIVIEAEPAKATRDADAGLHKPVIGQFTVKIN